MLGKRLRELRERQHISLDDLAGRSGLPSQQLALVESGDWQRLDNRDLIKLTDVLCPNNLYDTAYVLRLNLLPLRFKAYNVGLPKTGTTSIAGIFGNFRSAHEYSFGETVSTVMDFLSQRITYPEYRNWIKRRDVEAHLEMDSASFNHFYLDILADEFPSAKFIFTIRDCYSWLDSVINMYLRGAPARGHDPVSSRWMEAYTEFLFGVNKSVLQNEAELRTHFSQSIDRLLGCWASKNREILNRLPPDRSLVVRTHEISQKLDHIAQFVGIRCEELDGACAHLYEARVKFNFLHQVDFGFLNAKFNEHCSPLMQEYFPGYSLAHFLYDHTIPE